VQSGKDRLKEKAAGVLMNIGILGL
jgi:hypothetical protein